MKKYILVYIVYDGNCNNNEHHYKFNKGEWIEIGNKLLFLFYWKNIKININWFNKLNYSKKNEKKMININIKSIIKIIIIL